MKIPICVLADSNYLVPTYVMIHSMMYHANQQDTYEVFILVSDIL